uniref:ABC transporter ATP-binding protein n=1 Tax=Trichocoleus desertorum TaxID=1481672 RepID=UPI0025B61921|nr:ABC transporter ATP-binding protein [Trichocoleus desertorum]
MSEIVISLKNVSKAFKRYARPIDRLKESLLPGKIRADEFWALRDINLEVSKGQMLGIVGRNGSGKSTLLQLIAGTLKPTIGEVQVNGRISALLELGSGFNPEFTGRQNVFFNGQLLGLSQKEIERKFDDIASFADIGDFIEQPVKTYSSGMFVRLAFAVATSVDPDILVVDEALSVGDEAFQRKCFSRIQATHEKGGTILFVSHSAASVIELCNSAILIDRGELLLSGIPKLVVSTYQKLIYTPVEKRERFRQEIKTINREKKINILDDKGGLSSQEKPAQTLGKSRPIMMDDDGLNVDELCLEECEFFDENLIPKSTVLYVSRGAIIEDLCIENSEGKRVNNLVRGKEYTYVYSVKFSENCYQVRFGMFIKTISGLELAGASSHLQENAIEYVEAGQIIQVKFKFCSFLLPGVYFLNAGVNGIVDADEGEVFLHRCIDVAMFRVQSEPGIKASGFVDLCIRPSILFLQQMEPLTYI